MIQEDKIPAEVADVEMKDVDFELVLKQMRAHRIAACQAARKAKKMKELEQALSSMSESTTSLGDDSEQNQWIYWKRIQSGHAPPVRALSVGSIALNSNPSSPTSVHQSVRGIFEREVLTKLQDAVASRFDGRGETHNYSKYGKYGNCAKSLQYTQQDLHDLIDDHEFTKLQRSLRRNGAVTNELLRQNLPFVVKQSQESKRNRCQGKGVS